MEFELIKLAKVADYAINEQLCLFAKKTAARFRTAVYLKYQSFPIASLSSKQQFFDH